MNLKADQRQIVEQIKRQLQFLNLILNIDTFQSWKEKSNSIKDGLIFSSHDEQECEHEDWGAFVRARSGIFALSNKICL